MPELVKRIHVQIGVMTETASVAQDVANSMLKGGIRAIWNFTPTNLDVPDHVILQEQIATGERVREYVVEGRVGEQWVELARGKVIGHKWIHRFQARVVSSVRLRVTASQARPRIRSFTCLMVGAE